MARILLVGATGMVGSAFIGQAADDAITVLVRRRAANLPDCASEQVASPDRWPAAIAAVKPEIVVNCLGTTIRQAGSQAAFRAVDFDLVLAVASAARTAGARHFISVSSVGASAQAGNFYLRTKGEVEAALRALNFDRLDIIRPGLLTGERAGPARRGEALAMLAAPLSDAVLWGAMRRYRSVPAASVARAIAALARAGGSGIHVHEHDAIVQLAD